MRLLALLALGLAAAAPARAGPVVASSTAPLSLPDCAAIALRTAPTVRQAALKIQQARRQVYQAIAALGPSASLNAGLALFGYDNAGALIREPRYDDDTHVYTGAANWPVFNNFRDARAWKLARLGLESSRLDQTAAEQALLAEVVGAYFRQLLAVRLIDVRRRFRSGRVDHLAVTEKLYRAGVRSYTDLLDAKVQVRQQDLEVLRAERAERTSRAALNTLLERPLHEARPLVDVSGLPESRPDLESDLATALQRRTDARESRLALDRAQIGLRAAWSELFPDLTVNAALSYRFDEPRYTIAPGVRVSATNPYWQVGAAVSWTVFDGGARWQDVQRARLRLDAAREDQEALRRTVASEVLQAGLDLEEHRGAYEMSREELRNARESLAILLEQYRQGTASALQVKDAQNSLFSLEASESEALYRAHIARVALLRAVGTLTREAIQ